MRRARILIGITGAFVTAILATQGCQDPTQVTLEITLTNRTQCAEVPHGTAVTVGVEPVDVEGRVATGFVTAKTNECDPSTRRIGTLVVTPADPGRASVIVVVGYRKEPTECRPPKYEGCIVARRRWTFVRHRPLRMPITIDPKCADVPCEAFSTCRDGSCFSSEVDTNLCTGDGCIEPGATADGGTDIDAALDVNNPDVTNDGPIVPPDAPADSPTDAPSDAPTDGPNSPLPYCVLDVGNTLHCAMEGSGTDVACSGSTCCDGPSGAHVCGPSQGCMGDRYCCQNADCNLSDECKFGLLPPINAGRCRPKTGGTAPPYCTPTGELRCFSANIETNCNAPMRCCHTQTKPAVCQQETDPCISAHYCCGSEHCGGNACVGADFVMGKAGTCDVPPATSPICENIDGPLRCGTILSCNGPMFVCCQPAPGTCANAPAQCLPGQQACCRPEDCSGGMICAGKKLPAAGGGFKPGVCQAAQ